MNHSDKKLFEWKIFRFCWKIFNARIILYQLLFIKWKKLLFEYVVSSDESDFYSYSLYVLKTFQHIWANFEMNTEKHIVKEQLNIICMCQHTAKQTIYLEMFNKNENDFFRTNDCVDYHNYCCIVNRFDTL